MPDGSIVLLQACAMNPTGASDATALGPALLVRDSFADLG